MKHPFGMTAFILVIFLLSQFFGLVIIQHYHPTQEITNDLPLGFERPPTENPYQAVVMVLVAVLVGTGLFFLVIKFAPFLWKYWYFTAMAATLTFGLFPFFAKALGPGMSTQIIAGVIGVTGAFFKTWKPNVYVHNTTELFVYGGLAAIFVSLFDVITAIILLLGISVYDIIAVWHSKHMVKLATFQAESKVFAGIYLPYKAPKGVKVRVAKSKKEKAVGTSAILGGGDIGFPLIFAGVVLREGVPFWHVFIVPVFAAIGLGILFALSKQGKFYPAMPFVTAGCLAGYGILQLL